MIFVPVENILLLEIIYQTFQQFHPMKSQQAEKHEGEYTSSSQKSHDAELMYARQRNISQQKISTQQTKFLEGNYTNHQLLHERDQNSNTQKTTKDFRINDRSHVNMNVNITSGTPGRLSSVDHSTSNSSHDSITRDTDICHKLQGEFRRNGWNLAGANLLAVSCWIAKSQFLYARPRLTGLDFMIASIITAGCGVLARCVRFKKTILTLK